MSRVSTIAPPVLHADKVVYFATGSRLEVAADLRRLELRGNGTRLRVVAPAEFASQLPAVAPVSTCEVVPFRVLTAPLLWLRLLLFLGLSRRCEVICLTSQERFRLLKLLAMTLRGRVLFRHHDGSTVPLDPLALARVWLRRRWDAREERVQGFPIGVIGSASAESLQRIVAAVRASYPQAPIHGLLTVSNAESAAPLFDSARIMQPGLRGVFNEGRRLLRVKRTYQRWIIPCTNEGHAGWKFAAFLWPIHRRQIYNEFGDGFPARRLRTLGWHLRWRRRRNEQAREDAVAHFPIGVIGSASEDSLTKIVSVLRPRYPRAPIHGLLLPSATASTAALFDSVETFRPGLSSATRQTVRMRVSKASYQRWIVPCTGERSAFLKAMAFVWPMNRRQLYNEFADSFPAQRLDLLWRHLRWRHGRNRQTRAVDKIQSDARRPVGVIGCASGYYLEKIVPVVRECYPQIRIHGLLLPSATARTAALFDSVEMFEPGIGSAARQAFRMMRIRNAYQSWIVPCTNEPYRFLKSITFFWPLNRRQIYNELADGFPVRNFRMLWWHFRWRLRDRMSYQILAGTSGLSLRLRIVHRILYALRILGAVPLLGWTRLRALRNRWLELPGTSPAISEPSKGIGWNEERGTHGRRSAPGTLPTPRLPDESGGSVGSD
jgi:hypothetical protein